MCVQIQINALRGVLPGLGGAGKDSQGQLVAADDQLGVRAAALGPVFTAGQVSLVLHLGAALAVTLLVQRDEIFQPYAGAAGGIRIQIAEVERDRGAIAVLRVRHRLGAIKLVRIDDQAGLGNGEPSLAVHTALAQSRKINIRYVHIRILLGGVVGIICRRLVRLIGCLGRAGEQRAHGQKRRQNKAQ